MADELILIVEDNDRNRKLVRDVLQFKGFRTDEAENAELGLEKASAARPDLVLMDIQLPGMNGIEALGQLRAKPETRDIPVVAVTASVMSHDRERVMSAGFDGYVGKPIDINEFLETVSRALEARRTNR